MTYKVPLHKGSLFLSRESEHRGAHLTREERTCRPSPEVISTLAFASSSSFTSFIRTRTDHAPRHLQKFRGRLLLLCSIRVPRSQVRSSILSRCSCCNDRSQRGLDHRLRSQSRTASTHDRLVGPESAGAENMPERRHSEYCNMKGYNDNQ